MVAPVSNHLNAPLTVPKDPVEGQTPQGNKVKDLTNKAKKGFGKLKQNWQRFDKVEKGLIYIAILMILVALIALIALSATFGVMALAPVMTGLVYPLVTLATVPLLMAITRRNSRERKIEPQSYRRRKHILEEKLLEKRRLVAAQNQKRRKLYLEKENNNKRFKIERSKN